MTMIMRYPTAPLAAKMKSVAEVSTIERKVTCIAHDNGSNVKNFGRHSLNWCGRCGLCSSNHESNINLYKINI